MSTQVGFNIKNEKIIQNFYNMRNHREKLLMLQNFIYNNPTIQKSWKERIRERGGHARATAIKRGQRE